MAENVQDALGTRSIESQLKFRLSYEEKVYTRTILLLSLVVTDNIATIPNRRVVRNLEKAV